MNYRHRYHAGNFADVMKHALVMALFRALQRKPGGFLYLDTHAGAGDYDLSAAETGDTLPRRAEHPEGIGRLWGRDDLPAPLLEYVARVRASAPHAAGESTPRRYPGSPLLAAMLARPQDRLILCEWRPGEFTALRQRFAGRTRVSIEWRDGYGAIPAALPPPERRALVLIDPSYEDPISEWQRIEGALREGLRRLPSGVFAVWYPLTERARPERPPALPGRPPMLAAELTVDSPVSALRGCGLAVVNPPWKFEDEAEAILRPLSRLLAQGPAAGMDLRWIERRR
jgi:23S rRNA (adenine2030-N6)-methyltransferase